MTRVYSLSPEDVDDGASLPQPFGRQFRDCLKGAVVLINVTVHILRSWPTRAEAKGNYDAATVWRN